ncbi:MAG: peptidyl-prolyl cis-trans isomerase [Gammaproteobacteria bacterium]|nr:peptidyl-prolyl cis-trans isomerase [Gammaproteobacteria bacterium]MYH84563.1 peptidyl-prolyl cis-trans isomerase [Gammaproteobacteria bacterium]MYK04196.1 peptidyl-prolyl cis-trans isomerase [Gammaproteobacteria bacterium]
MTENNPDPSTLKKLLHEPMTHFVVLAVLLFGVYGVSSLGGGELLEVRQQDIDARIFMQELSTGRELTEEERDQITALYIEEQILVREAVRLDLDNDARIHDMLAQKMRHVLSGDVIQPDEAELRAYYEANRDRYTTLETVDVVELVFDTPDDPVEEALAVLAAGGEPEEILALEPGTDSPLPRVNRLDLSNIFSDEFSERVFAAQIDEWVGPYVSNRGQHWLRVLEREEAELADFEEIVERVRLDWIATEEDRLLQIEVDRLWDDYVIVIND